MSNQFQKKLPTLIKSASVLAMGLVIASTDVVFAQEAPAPGTSVEILVTATRRAESVYDVPYNISAVSGEDLEAANVVNLADLTRIVPGVAYADLGARASVNNQLILRGLNVAAAGGVNAFLANNTPAGVSTYFNDTPIFTNLKLNDLNRVEVLRGPQGTLYGANSIGGTLRFIFNKPNTEEFSASMDAGVSFPKHSSDVSYNVDMVANLPLTENIALRVAGGYEEIAGFVDANGFAVGGTSSFGLEPPGSPFFSAIATSPQEDIDGSDVYYIRASLLWDVTEDIEAYFVYHRQVDDAEGLSAQTPGGTPRAHDQTFNSPYKRVTDVYALELDIDLGFASLESSTSYSDNKATTSDEGSGISGLPRSINVFTGGALGGPFNSGLAGYFTEDIDEETFAQEVRLVSQYESDFSWILGLYYQDIQRTRFEEVFVPGFSTFATTPGNPFVTIPGIPLGFGFPGATPKTTLADFGILDFATFLGGPPTLVPLSAVNEEIFLRLDEAIDTEDIAIFGELSYDVTDRWNVTFGARVFWNDVTTSLDYAQPLSGGLASTPPGLPSGAGSVTSGIDIQSQIFKVNTSYDITDDVLAYFTWSEGFRRGGGNATPTAGIIGEDISLLVFQPDTVTNYEVGVKGTLLDRLDYTLAYFYLNWNDPQVPTSSAGGLPVVINAGEAMTQGIEFEGSLELFEGLTFSGGYTYVDAEFTQDFASAPAPVTMSSTVITSDGNRLPGVPEHSATWSLDYVHTVNMFGGSEIHARVDGSYRSNAVTAADPSLLQFAVVDGFSIWNASLSWQNENWRVTAFVRNLADEEGIGAVVRDFAAAGPIENLDFLSRPRTFGFSVGASF